MKRLTKAAAVCFAASASLAFGGCSPSDEAATPTNDDSGYSGPDHISITQSFSMNGWEIGQSGSAFAGTFYSAVYDPLYLIDGANEPYGVVAQDTEISEDGLTYTFNVRPGVVFTDGTELDAAGVVTNLEYLAAGFGTASTYAKVAGFAALDEDTVEMTLSSPDPVLLYNMGLGGSYLASPTALASPDYAEATAPSGSGPYVFDEAASLVPTDYVFTRNENHWEADRWPWSYLEIHVVQDFTGAGTAQNMLTAGDTNVMYASWRPGLEDDAEANGWEMVENYSAWDGVMIADRAGDVIEPLADPKVRLALNLVMDREARLAGATVDPGTYVTNQVFAKVDPDVESYPYDIEQAKALLAEAGYADGFSFDVPAGGYFDDTMALIAQEWAEVGVIANMVQLTPDVYNQQVFAGKWPVFAAKLQLYGNPMKTVQDYFTTGAMNNPFDSSAKDPVMTDLIAQFYEAGADTDAISKQINEHITAESWFGITAHTRDLYVLADGLTVKPVQGLYVPNFQQFLPDAK
ncbi:MAG: ABC transporter substrate-binding protein [Bifidobacteriaceae bacterium]|jgi:peptide/nickel transport system substrate-binding protein|nr:ABC transporter substrate-binding protein [Bifidobacteriaceae bacterium]